MSLTRDILRSYRAPSEVIAKHHASGPREDHALILLLVACGLFFVAQTPWQAREAHLNSDVPLQARLYWSAFFLIFLLPISAYVFTAICYGPFRILGWIGSGFDLRLSFFWALLASTPLALFTGGVWGLMGPGIQAQIMTAFWVLSILLFWALGLRSLWRARA